MSDELIFKVTKLCFRSSEQYTIFLLRTIFHSQEEIFSLRISFLFFVVLQDSLVNKFDKNVKELSALWIPPRDYSGTIAFYLTVMPHGSRSYYLRVKSPPLRPVRLYLYLFHLCYLIPSAKSNDKFFLFPTSIFLPSDIARKSVQFFSFLLCHSNS